MRFRDIKGNFRYTPRRVLTSAVRRVKEPLIYAELVASARTSSRQLTDPTSDVVITLTTHGPRLRNVHLTVESIARGSMLPRRVILFLDSPLPADLPAGLRRLIKRGLEVESTPGEYGPHTKYYPFVANRGNDLSEDLLVTADDDVVYPRTWLQDLRQAYRPGVKEVICHRAHRFHFIDGSVAPYNEWSPVRSITPSSLNMATGVSGILYPPGMQEAMRMQGEGFRDRAPIADDVWLHWVALESGFRIRQIRSGALNLPTLWRSQKTSLLSENANLSRNDVQIAKCYSTNNIETLLSSDSDGCN